MSLEHFYCDIVSAVKEADNSLPRIKHGLAKPFWSPDLDVAKQKSIDAHEVWVTSGRPSSGPIFLEKFRANHDYKSLLRKSKAQADHCISDSLSADLLSNRGQSFWRKWNRLRGPNISPTTMVDGNLNDKDIANCFASSFQRIYTGSPANDCLREKFLGEYDIFHGKHINDSIVSYLFSWSDMMDAAFQLKLNKASSSDGFA